MWYQWSFASALSMHTVDLCDMHSREHLYEQWYVDDRVHAFLSLSHILLVRAS